jgi:hypothetical protein
MNKKFATVFIFMLTIVRFVSVGQEINVKITAPEEVTAGEVNVIYLHIFKNKLTGFARLQQNFPLAIGITEDDPGGGDFSFKNGNLNLIWLNLPKRDEIVIRYYIEFDRTVKGDFELTGKFSYIVDSEREELTFGPRIIHVNPSPLVEEDQVVDIYSFKGNRPGSMEPEYSVAAVLREKPYLSVSGDGWIVNLIVNRGALEKMARIEELVSNRFTAENIESHNAVFSFKNGVVRYNWMNIPPEEYFTVSYKLIPIDGNMEKPPVIKGTISYMKGENMNSLQVFEKDISFHTMDKQELADYVAAFAAEMEGRSVQRQVATKIINEPAPVKTGVYFRVQILATSKSVDAERYFSKLKLGRIFKEYIEGLYKYTTGTFTYYKDAKYFIDKLGRVNLNEAFVIAYQDGERIPVRKALRLTNQKWIK